MEFAEALSTLGLGESENRSAEELKRAYLKQVRVHSPERDPQGFQRVREAYELLRGWNDTRPFFRQSGPVSPSVEAALVKSEPRADKELEPTVAPVEPPEVAAEPPAPIVLVPEPAPPSSPIEELNAALDEQRPAAAGKALIEIYARADASSPVPPAQLTLDISLQLFVLGKDKRARQLLVAFAAYMDQARIPLSPRLSANWKLLSELSALSRKVTPDLTRALAESIESGQFEHAVPEIRAEIAASSESQVWALMQTHAPSLFSATSPLMPRKVRRRSFEGWTSRGVVFGIFVLLRSLSWLFASNEPYQVDGRPTFPRRYEPAAVVARQDRELDREHEDTEPSTIASAASPIGDYSTLSVADANALSQVTKPVEKAYLSGLCSELSLAWGAYVSVVRRLPANEAVKQGYEARRTQALGACPEQASDLPEQP